MAVPNVAFIGFPKCGSSSFYTDFQQHPDIFAGNFSESPAFANAFWRGAVAPLHEFQNFGQYRGQSVIMDVHPATIYVDEAMHALLARLGSVKIVFCVRDPAARTMSSYRYGMARYYEKRSLPAMLAEERSLEYSGFTYNTPGLSNHVWHSRYELFLPRVYELFGAENVFPILFEDYFGPGHGETLRSLQDFLEVANIPLLTQADENKSSPGELFLGTAPADKGCSIPVAALRNPVDGSLTRAIYRPSSATTQWFEEALIAQEENKTVDLDLSGLFDDTIAYCEDVVFNRSLTGWRGPRKVAAGRLQRVD